MRINISDGNKGIISAILPDNEMPMSEDGIHRAEVVLNSLGVVGRMNPAQLYEQELNFIATDIWLKNKGDEWTEENYTTFVANIMRFYEIACPEYHKYLEAQRENALDYFDEYFVNAANTGLIPIHQPPFYGNADPDVMNALYTEFPVEKIKFVGITTPLVCGKLYYIKLKHESDKKFSARSSGQANLLDVPYRSNERFKKGNALYNSNPVKMGEQEYFNLTLLQDPTGQDEFLKTYSSSSAYREAMLEELLLTDAEQIARFELPAGASPVSNSAQTVRAMFRGLGINIENDNE